MDKITILIVDDHAVVRQGLRTFLDLVDDVEVVGEAHNGAVAVERVQDLLPDVVLMDLLMPELDGIEATRRIRALSPTTQVIALTSFSDDDQVVASIRAGAVGYLLKNVSPADLTRAIRSAYRGEAQLDPKVAKKLMEEVAGRRKQATLQELTEREMDVLRLIATGLSNREIASELVIAEKTVKTHVSNILGKLHLADRTQAAIYALQQGLAKEG